MKIINCHTHIFTNRHVPGRMLVVPGLVYFISNNPVGRKIAKCIIKFLDNLDPDENDQFSRIARFAEMGNHKKQETIFKKLQSLYPKDTRFIILPMDFEFMKAGKPKKTFSYLHQIEDLAKLKNKKAYKGLIFPFVFAEARRKDVDKHVKKYINQNKFTGIKIYPGLGYFPFDDRLDAVYDFALEKKIPVMSHGSPASFPVNYRERKSKMRKELKKYFPDKNLKKLSKSELASLYNHPNNFKRLLEKNNGKYKKLKICLAHAGGSQYWNKILYDPPLKEDRSSTDNWFYIIKDMIRSGKYPNLYTDISATLNYESLIPSLKLILTNDAKLKNKILFGSDFYMTLHTGREKHFSINLREKLGEKLFELIAVKNSNKFLNLKK